MKMTDEQQREDFIKVLKEAHTSLLILQEDIKYPLSEDRQKWLDGATLLIQHLFEKEMEADIEAVLRAFHKSMREGCETDDR
jgi:hypothetical protein